MLYAAHGAPSSIALGNGLTETATYNNRLQALQIQAGSLLTLSYGYGMANNGNVQSQTITRGGGVWTETYGYDGVNRLTSAGETGTGAWSQTFGYDAFGNRWLPGKAGLPDPTGETPTLQSWYANTPVNNRVVGWGYDGAGNLTGIAGGVRSSSYDAENRVTATTASPASATYSYDGEGRRVTKTVGGQTTVYVYDAAGNLAAEYGASAGAGRRYLTADALGSTRLVTDANGAAVRCYDYLPFGEEIAAGTAGRSAPCFTATSPSPDTVSDKFTGKERDAETGLDYFGARYFSGAQGRFTTPDWSARPQPVPYADLSDPQTLNLYAYVRNNPLRRTDPDGHADVAALCQGQTTCQKTITDTVNLVHYDKKTKSTVVDSTLKITTNFSLTTDAKGKVNVAAASTVANVSGHQYSDSQLTTMGKSIGAVQQSAVMMGFGGNTTQMMTALGAAETAFGTARAGESSPFKAPDINPLQLSGGRANGDLMHNIQGALNVFDYFGRKVGFDAIPTYRGYSDGSVPTMANFTSIYGSVKEEQR